jgi:hypothetical protein
MAFDNVTLEVRQEAETLYIEALPHAVRQLVHIARYGESEKARMEAASKIIDRCLGKVPDKLEVDAFDPVRELLANIIVAPSVEADKAEQRAINKAREIREARERAKSNAT